MPSLTDRLTRWIAPEPPPNLTAAPAPDPPLALSAAATAPPASIREARIAPEPPPWQEKAWQYYRHCGEARRAVDWIAHGLSRCHLYIGKIDTTGVSDPEPVEDAGVAGEVLDELHDGPVGQSHMMKRLATHVLVPGESWLIGYPRPRDPLDDDTTDRGRTAWVVASRKEWQLVDEQSIRLKLPEHPEQEADGWVSFPADQVVTVRVYDPDAEDAAYATSPFEAAMAPLEELDGLDARVAADIQSRLVGAGLYELPESATMPNPQQSESIGVNPINGFPLIHGITQAAKVAIKNPDSPEAVIPIFYTTSDEAAGKGRHIPFWSDFDQQVPVLRSDARKRLASIMDIPGEIIEGIADVNHWGGWLIDESAIKAHIGPLASLICTTLTRKILWPALKASGMSATEIKQLAIWWDAREIILRPDRTKETLEAHKQGIIGGKPARRELGYTEDDAPTAQEQQPAAPDGGQQDQNEPGNRQGGQPTPSDRPEPPQGDSNSTSGPRRPS